MPPLYSSLAAELVAERRRRYLKAAAASRQYFVTRATNLHIRGPKLCQAPLQPVEGVRARGQFQPGASEREFSIFLGGAARFRRSAPGNRKMYIVLLATRELTCAPHMRLAGRPPPPPSGSGGGFAVRVAQQQSFSGKALTGLKFVVVAPPERAIEWEARKVIESIARSSFPSSRPLE